MPQLYDGVPANPTKRLNQLLRGERLDKKREASRVQRSLANGRVPVSGYVNHRHGNPSGFEMMPQLDA